MALQLSGEVTTGAVATVCFRKFVLVAAAGLLFMPRVALRTLGGF
jgi:hypothetical protein